MDLLKDLKVKAQVIVRLLWFHGVSYHLSLWPLLSTPQISFACCVEGVKQTGTDKRIHAGSISPR